MELKAIQKDLKGKIRETREQHSLRSDTGEYRTEVQDKVLWCEDHNLILNVDKTKEMIFDPKVVKDSARVFTDRRTASQRALARASGPVASELPARRTPGQFFYKLSLSWTALLSCDDGLVHPQR
ncbi:hypothetical protein N1851_022363 [Merluccius polli]|uniref:Uncharacterized protein n=1 Tax=Merluccius polli TaxID=89951 RepID=A0AA47MHZ5_MERPO|nr:hypothetical protein N1851_022363 [Merluccius polli]